jgi:hypothetical protein
MGESRFSKMLPQLLLSKRLVLEGKCFAERGVPISCGLAISLFQDSVELYLWGLIKERDVPVNENSGFTRYLDAFANNAISIPFKTRLLELNKARVSFKHYGILPAHNEAAKFKQFTETFLYTAMNEHFGIDYEMLSLVDLVGYENVRNELRNAEASIEGSNLIQAACHVAVAKDMLLEKLERVMPRPDKGLDERSGELKYIRSYLDGLRELGLASLLQISLDDYGFLQGSLPRVSRAMSGDRSTVFTRSPSYSPEDTKRMILIVVELSIRSSRHLQVLPE